VCELCTHVLFWHARTAYLLLAPCYWADRDRSKRSYDGPMTLDKLPFECGLGKSLSCLLFVARVHHVNFEPSPDQQRRLQV